MRVGVIIIITAFIPPTLRPCSTCALWVIVTIIDNNNNNIHQVIILATATSFVNLVFVSQIQPSIDYIVNILWILCLLLTVTRPRPQCVFDWCVPHYRFPCVRVCVWCVCVTFVWKQMWQEIQKLSRQAGLGLSQHDWEISSAIVRFSWYWKCSNWLIDSSIGAGSGYKVNKLVG